MSDGNGNGHGGDDRIDVLEERVADLMKTLVAQQVTLTTLRVLNGLQQAEIDNLRERVERLEGR